jgi:5-formyltetrahydrofolate cyclo-ligase
MDRAQLRIALRKQRRSVRTDHAEAVANRISRRLLRIVSKGQHIAVYSAFDGEVDLGQFIVGAQRLGCTLYLPRIVNQRARRMEFHPLMPIANTVRLRFSRVENSCNRNRRVDPRALDIVLLPLVAFDIHGWRLGFGAGFYDRKFHFLRRQSHSSPRMIGVAYEFQRVAPQVPSSWDVLLDAVVTEAGIQPTRHPFP